MQALVDEKANEADEKDQFMVTPMSTSVDFWYAQNSLWLDNLVRGIEDGNLK